MADELDRLPRSEFGFPDPLRDTIVVAIAVLERFRAIRLLSTVSDSEQG